MPFAKPSEKRIEAYLKQRVERLGGICYKFVSPARRGVPDRLCVFPKGHYAFVEVKGPAGKLSGLQVREIDRLNRLQQPVFVVYSDLDVDKFIDVVRPLVLELEVVDD